MAAALATAFTLAIILFFDWVPTPLNRNIAHSTPRDRLIGDVIHLVTGALVVAANHAHWRWVILAGAIWYTFVLVTAILNWWVPWVTGVARGEITPDQYEREYAANLRVLPRLPRSTLIPDVQHTIIHVAVLITAILNWTSAT